mgnify:CR=1 FL=1
MPIVAKGVEKRVAEYMEILSRAVDEACKKGDSCLAISRRTGVNHGTLAQMRRREYDSVLSLKSVIALCEEFDIAFRIGSEG